MCGRDAVGASVCSAGFGCFRAADGSGATTASSPASGVTDDAGADREPARPFGPGGGAVGTGIGCDASLLARPPVRPRRLLGRAVPLELFLASLTARRLIGPRTGTRGTKTQPTLGTGLPPMSRPSSNNQSYSPPWNSW